MQIKTVKIEKPDDTNFVLGQTHFIKSVEDSHSRGGRIRLLDHHFTGLLFGSKPARSHQI